MRIIGMLISAWLFLIKLVLCKILHLHKRRIVSTHFYRLIGESKRGRLERNYIRKVVKVCQRCEAETTSTLKRRVAHDWQYPERLFPKEG